MVQQKIYKPPIVVEHHLCTSDHGATVGRRQPMQICRHASLMRALTGRHWHHPLDCGLWRSAQGSWSFPSPWTQLNLSNVLHGKLCAILPSTLCYPGLAVPQKAWALVLAATFVDWSVSSQFGDTLSRSDPRNASSDAIWRLCIAGGGGML